MENQSGFHCNISTTHAMLDVVTSSYDSIDDHTYTGLAFCLFKEKHLIQCRELFS